MDTRAWVQEDFGMAPNWLGSTISKIAGPTQALTTKSSETFDRAGVSEIGLICFETTGTGLTLDSGVTSAYFHCEGSLCSANEEFKIEHTGSARTSA